MVIRFVFYALLIISSSTNPLLLLDVQSRISIRRGGQYCKRQGRDGDTASFSRLNIRPDWYKKSQEEDMIVVHFKSREDVREKVKDAMKRAGMDATVEDVILPTTPTALEDAKGKAISSSFTKKTLRQICQLYHFSMGYLGDYVCSLGVNPPLNIDDPVGDYMSGEQLLSLLTAVSTVQPHEANRRFCDNSASLISIAKDLNVSISYLVDMCGEMEVKVPLPFGIHSMIHSRLVQDLVKEINGRRKYPGFGLIPPFNSEKDGIEEYYEYGDANDDCEDQNT